MGMTYRDPATLPKWAQAQLAAAQRRAKAAEERLAVRESAADKTRVWYGDYDHKIYLPDVYAGRSTSVYFQLDPEDDNTDRLRNQVHVRIIKDHDGQMKLDIMAGTGVVIEPSGGVNCIKIALRD